MSIATEVDLQALYGRRPRVLVVDDQPANVQALYQVFAADHQVFMATTGAQALGVCEAQHPDLVLLDVEMPGLDGYQVCERLKVDPALRDIPVIFVTAHEDEVAEARALDAGAVDFITKPIKPRIVRARARTHLTLKHQSDLLRQWAYIDGLTVVGNRRLFDDRLAMEWARAVRQRTSLSVVLIDVDHFKRFNDRYGHQAGDDCLRRVAAALKAGLRRPADLLARYGGEEFVCLLPETDATGALALAEQLGRAVRELGIEHTTSDVAAVVTVSLGACTQPAGVVGSAATLLREADAQLYAAKSSGRDQARATSLSAP
ncbi:MAG: diguanylate cyclase [Rubrivivax sp.]|nr:diguanylate cyclase [Rubrivivax sp.]